MGQIRVSDYIAQYLAEKKLNTVFAISGASALRILDSIHHHPELEYYCPHHEQAGIMAAIGHFRITKQPGVMLVTAGPGGTNTVTGIASAFLDSIPLLVFGGQEKLEFLTSPLNLRGKGVQGLNLVEIVKPITKYSVIVSDPKKIRYHLERALFEATSGRPGPVWLDIPQDIQSVFIVPEDLECFVPPEAEATTLEEETQKTISLLKDSKRPLIWAGHGIRLAKAEKEFLSLANKLGVPVLTAWNGADLLPEDHPCYAGRAGTYGNRASNFILQNCDLLIALGTRLAIPQMGYSQKEFARDAKKVIVEIDPQEMEKFTFAIDVPVVGCVGNFIGHLSSALKSTELKMDIASWKDYCRNIRKKYPPVSFDQKQSLPEKINSYHFMDRFTEVLPNDYNIVTDMGTSLTCTHAVFRIKDGQRLVTSTGLGEMGYGLPAAIGVAIASSKQNKKTVMIGAEGSLQMNIQELQTVIHHKLPLKIFILNNDTYLTIRHTEIALFGPDRLSGCTNETGVSFPNLGKVSEAYGFKYFEISSEKSLEENIQKILNTPGPVFCNVFMPQDQFLGPKSAVKVKADGTLFSPPLEDMYPFLEREEFKQNMLIPLIEEK